ncbi:primosomal protein N' [Deinococcus sp. KNUC1210]|uniref:replication restart helicase PriA n=1 Tax=Deinococcus sp. KNUC1210 TaxID=2917691 RepID=UPI001EF1290C|nr:primosomal protein N' [Deinococcus sp. KNUC1210]ULH15223.1 primosomal protein N' [Deinococcus sp. KNUC1210]
MSALPHSPTPWLIALPIPAPALDFLPPHGWNPAQPTPTGHRVLIPWRGELSVGLVVGTSDTQGRGRLREAVHLLDDAPHVHPAFVEATCGLSRLSRIPLGLLLCDFVGVGWEARYLHSVRAVAGADLGMFADAVPGAEWSEASSYAPGLLDRIREQGLLDEAFGAAPRTVTGYRARRCADVPVEARYSEGWQAEATGTQPLTPKQQQAWLWLKAHGPVSRLSEWSSGAGVGAGVVRGVLERGWATSTLHERPLPPAWELLNTRGPFASQAAWAEAAGVPQSAVTRLLAQGWAESVSLPAPPPALPAASTWLPRPVSDTMPQERIWRLHGGREAERFSRLAPRIRRLLELGRGVTILAPDSATLRGAWEHLSGLALEAGTRALCFSGTLSEVQREHAWAQVQRGEAGLVIGTALALCAPHADLGLIVVLEEGSDAHKLLSGSRAFVPDLAERMAAAGDIPLALLGCVPAAESLLHPGPVLPPPRQRLHIVDYAAPTEQPQMGPLSSPHLKPSDLGYPISHDLGKVLRQVQARGRQAVLLAPRRGYSALLRCSSCQYTPGCPNCDVSLRFHQERRALHCHQCGYEVGIPDRCDHCGDPMWQARGPGTEWIVQEVKKLLPGFPVYRYDRDHQDDLSALDAGEPGVVVGTQALLSLTCPPNLALIGVTLADTWLNISDFRAGERYHRLLRQLLGWHPERAPLTVVQTFQAEHPALQCVLHNRDAGYYPALEAHARQDLGYPPHRLLTFIEVAARDRGRAAQAAQDVADTLHGAGAVSQEVLGPAPSPLARVRGVYPYQLLLRTRNEERLNTLLSALDRRFSARVRVDLSPRGLG